MNKLAEGWNDERLRPVPDCESVIVARVVVVKTTEA